MDKRVMIGASVGALLAVIVGVGLAAREKPPAPSSTAGLVLAERPGDYIVAPAEPAVVVAEASVPEAVAIPVSNAGSLPLGEYACYGSGGSVLAGLGFKLLGGNSYTDLDGASRGSYAISGSTIAFTGGHLDGQTGRDLTAKGFRIGAMATCELWG